MSVLFNLPVVSKVLFYLATQFEADMPQVALDNSFALNSFLHCIALPNFYFKKLNSK